MDRLVLRMNKYLTILCVLFLALTQTLFAQNSTLRVGTVEIIIKKETLNQSIDKQSIAKRLKTKPGVIFSQLDFDEDLKLLVDEFDNVEPILTFKGKEVNIILEIYPKLYIRNINFCGNNTVPTSDLRDELDIATGIPLDRYAFNEAFHKLRTFYIKNGYFEADLSYSIIEDTCTNQVDIQISIKEGPSGKIRAICVEGVDECEERQVLNPMVTKEYCFFTVSNYCLIFFVLISLYIASWTKKSSRFHLRNSVS